MRALRLSSISQPALEIWQLPNGSWRARVVAERSSELANWHEVESPARTGPSITLTVQWAIQVWRKPSRPQFECLHCGHVWQRKIPRYARRSRTTLAPDPTKETRPSVCPQCHTGAWERPPYRLGEVERAKARGLLVGQKGRAKGRNASGRALGEFEQWLRDAREAEPWPIS